MRFTRTSAGPVALLTTTLQWERSEDASTFQNQFAATTLGGYRQSKLLVVGAGSTISFGLAIRSSAARP